MTSETVRNQLRQLAANRGETTFDTGEPCKRGHYSRRYVSNGGCLTCMRKTFTPKNNPFSKVFAPYINDSLWGPANLEKSERVALRLYLQLCIFEFARTHVVPKLSAAKQAEMQEAIESMTKQPLYSRPEDPRNTD